MLHCPPAAMPFAGLGFDLSDLMARAGLMRLVPLIAAPGTGLRPRAGAPSRPHGYGLLVALSREIRGR